jgi:hypothetical protein
MVVHKESHLQELRKSIKFGLEYQLLIKALVLKLNINKFRNELNSQIIIYKINLFSTNVLFKYSIDI